MHFHTYAIFIFCRGIGEMLCSDVVEMRSILCKFGSLDSNAFVSTPSSNFDGLYMPKGKRYCFAAFEDVDSAKRAFQFFTLNCDISELNVKNLDVKFSHLATNKNELPQSTSETENIVIPGLCLIENFVDDDLQAKLLEDLSSEAAPWKVSLSRRVQVIKLLFLNIVFATYYSLALRLFIQLSYVNG